MGKQIKLTKTDVFLLGLTLLFAAAVALTWLLTPHRMQGDYEISAAQAQDGEVAQVRTVNINTATVNELDALPGIGPVLAQRIVDWRAENGAFTDVEQLTQVNGIGEAILENIRVFITTEDTDA